MNFWNAACHLMTIAGMATQEARSSSNNGASPATLALSHDKSHAACESDWYARNQNCLVSKPQVS